MASTAAMLISRDGRLPAVATSFLKAATAGQDSWERLRAVRHCYRLYLFRNRWPKPVDSAAHIASQRWGEGPRAAEALSVIARPFGGCTQAVAPAPPLGETGSQPASHQFRRGCTRWAPSAE